MRLETFVLKFETFVKNFIFFRSYYCKKIKVMKTLKFFLSFTLVFFIHINFINAQIDVNKIKNKAKDVKTKTDKVTNNLPTDTKVTNENDNDQSNNGENNNKIGTPYMNLINEKYTMVYQNDDNLNLYDIERNGVNPQEHYNGALKLDYSNLLKTLNEKGKQVGVDEQKYNTLLNYGKKYEELFNGIIKNQINRLIEDAYKNKKSELGLAAKSIKNAYLIAQAVNMIIPENEDAKKLLSETKSSYESIYVEYEKMVYTSDFHKQNAGKILFSKTPIVIGKEKPEQFKTSFTANDKIYAVVYLNTRIKDAGTGYSTGEYTVSIDGGNPYYIRFGHNESDYEISYYIIELIPDPNIAVHGLDPIEFAKILAPLSPREHTLKLGFGFQYSDPIVTGEIKLDWKEVNPDAITENNKLASKNAQDNWARNTVLPDIYSTTSQKFTEPAITSEKIKSMFMEKYPECVQILKMIITEKKEGYDEWYVFKNNVGIPEEKRSMRYIYIVYKAKDGWCYFTDGSFLYQDYEGGGKFGNYQLSGTRKTKISCANVK